MFIESNGAVLNLSLCGGWRWSDANCIGKIVALVILDKDLEVINLDGIDSSFAIDEDKVDLVNRRLLSGEVVMCENYCTAKDIF